MKYTSYLSKLKEFIKSKKEPLIVYHFDPDGICSADIFSRAFVVNKTLPSLTGKPYVTKKLKNEILTYSYDSLVFLDMPVDQDSSNIRDLAENSDILIIDHHEIKEDLNSKHIVHINNHLFGETKYYPASKLVYDLLTDLKYKIKSRDWVSAVGTISDFGFPQWESFIKKVNKRYGLSGIDFNSDLGKIANLLNSNRIKLGRTGASLGLKLLSLSSNPLDILEKKSDLAKEMWRRHDKVQAKIDKLIKSFEEKAEKFEDTYILKINKDEMGSTVSTILSHKYPDKTIVILQVGNYNQNCIFSIRRNDGKVDVSLLAQKITKGLKAASGGGHKKAAGGNFLKKDLSKVKNRIIKYTTKK